MKRTLQQIIFDATGADDVFHIEDIQSLWCGYGKIIRYGLTGCERDSVVVKHVKLTDRGSHPRGWNTDRSHQRKISSYHVEIAWYRNWSRLCNDGCRVPQCLALEEGENDFLMVFGKRRIKNAKIRFSIFIIIHYTVNLIKTCDIL